MNEQQGNIVEDVVKPLTVFYLYAPTDETLHEKMEKHLSLLQRENLIANWSERMLVPGTDWAQETDKQLDAASIILLLISPDFMASDYCYGVEMRRALERHKSGATQVIPVLLRPVDWKGAPFAHLQCLPDDQRPITTWINEDEAFLNVAQGIRRVVDKLRGVVDIPARPAETVGSTVSGQELYRYNMHSDYVTTVAWSPDGKYIASAGLDSTIYVWQATTRSHLLTYRGHFRRYLPHNVLVLRWSPDGSCIASAGIGGTVHVWDSVNGQKVTSYEGHSKVLPSIFHLAWSPDGRSIASTNIALLDEAIHIWDAISGQKILKIDLRRSLQITASAGGVSWSPDGQLIAGSWDKKVRIYQAASGKYISTYEDHQDLVVDVAWSPDGKYIASAAKHKVNIWLPATDSTHRIYTAHAGNMRRIAWSPNGKYIASASEDKTVHVWEPATGKQLLIYRGHSNQVTDVAWSPDGTLIASSSRDNTVHIWQVFSR